MKHIHQIRLKIFYPTDSIHKSVSGIGLEVKDIKSDDVITLDYRVKMDFLNTMLAFHKNVERIVDFR